MGIVLGMTVFDDLALGMALGLGFGTAIGAGVGIGARRGRP
jgi:hypothetical protein